MALGQHEAVTLRVLRAFRENVQHAEEKRGQNVGGRHLSADMACAGFVDSLHVAQAYLPGNLLEFPGLHVILARIFIQM